MTEFSMDSMYFNVIIIVIFNSSRLSFRIGVIAVAAAAAAAAATTLLEPATFRLSRIPRISKLP